MHTHIEDEIKELLPAERPLLADQSLKQRLINKILVKRNLVYLIALTLVPATFYSYYSQSEASTTDQSEAQQRLAGFATLVNNVPLNVYFGGEYLSKTYCAFVNPSINKKNIFWWLYCAVIGYITFQMALSSNAENYVGEIDAFSTLNESYSSWVEFNNIFLLCAMSYFFSADLFGFVYKTLAKIPACPRRFVDDLGLHGRHLSDSDKSKIRLSLLYINKYAARGNQDIVLTSIRGLLRAGLLTVTPESKVVSRAHALDQANRVLLNFYNEHSLAIIKETNLRNNRFINFDWSTTGYWILGSALSLIACSKADEAGWFCSPPFAIYWLNRAYNHSRTLANILMYLVNFPLFLFFGIEGANGFRTILDGVVHGNIQRFKHAATTPHRKFSFAYATLILAIQLTALFFTAYSVFPSLFKISQSGNKIINNPLIDAWSAYPEGADWLAYGKIANCINAFLVNASGTLLIFSLFTTLVYYLSRQSPKADKIIKHDAIASCLSKASAFLSNPQEHERNDMDLAFWETLKEPSRYKGYAMLDEEARQSPMTGK